MLDGSERGQLEHDAPVPILADAADVVRGAFGAAAHGDERPVAVDRRGVALGNEFERKARRREHLFWSDLAARDGARALGSLGEVAARFDPQELVRSARAFWIVPMHTLHALGKLLHDLFGARVDRLALARDEPQRERQRNRDG